jgi:hypothetical protein
MQRAIMHILADRLTRAAAKRIQKTEDIRVFKTLRKMAMTVNDTIKTVVLQRDAKDGISGGPLKRGSKAVRFEVWKGCRNQITFYSESSARQLNDVLTKAIEDMEKNDIPAD